MIDLRPRAINVIDPFSVLAVEPWTPSHFRPGMPFAEFQAEWAARMTLPGLVLRPRTVLPIRGCGND